MSACRGGLPDTLAGCADASCRSDWVVAAWSRDRAEAVAAADQIADPVERMAVLIRLVETWPGETAQLCEKLTRGPVRQRCERIHARPHLWTAPAASAPALRAASGPGDIALPSLGPSASRFADVQPLAGPCAQRRDTISCYTGQAVREVGHGATRRAAAACAAIAVEKWRFECMFSAAEEVIETRGAEGVADSSDLCLAAGDFASNCIRHLVERLARDTPDATVTDPAVWAGVRRGADRLRETWSARDSRLAELYVGRYWSEVARFAYGWTSEVTGGPLAVLSAEAAPYVRASAAARLVALDGLQAHATLADWTDALRDALARTASASLDHPREDLNHDAEIFWPEDVGAEDSTIPAIFYMGTARRAVSPDPEVDLQLCILEAIARQGLVSTATPVDRAAALRIVAEGLGAADGLVRWTAARLRDRAPVSDR